MIYDYSPDEEGIPIDDFTEIVIANYSKEQIVTNLTKSANMVKELKKDTYDEMMSVIKEIEDEEDIENSRKNIRKVMTIFMDAVVDVSEFLDQGNGEPSFSMH